MQLQLKPYLNQDLGFHQNKTRARRAYVSNASSGDNPLTTVTSSRGASHPATTLVQDTLGATIGSNENAPVATYYNQGKIKLIQKRGSPRKRQGSLTRTRRTKPNVNNLNWSDIYGIAPGVETWNPHVKNMKAVSKSPKRQRSPVN